MKKKGRPPKAYSQAERLGRMMRALASRAMTVKDLAEEFEITRRQVYRDVDRIQEEGHPLEQSDGDSEKTWQLPLGYKGLPPITLSPYELMSLQLARADLAYLNGTPFVEDLDLAVAKLRAADERTGAGDQDEETTDSYMDLEAMQTDTLAMAIDRLVQSFESSMPDNSAPSMRLRIGALSLVFTGPDRKRTGHVQLTLMTDSNGPVTATLTRVETSGLGALLNSLIHEERIEEAQ